MKNLSFDINRELADNATSILDEVGLDIPSAVNMFLRRLVKEKNLMFLLINSSIKTQKTFTQNAMYAKQDMTKNRAVRIFKEAGITLGKNVTFTSKNHSANHYWANPDFNVLDTDWELILNDWINRELYLFSIPANTLTASDLVARGDKKHKIDLQIAYGNSSFLDNRSGYSFAKHLVKQIKY